jgi:hypothetical protein
MVRPLHLFYPPSKAHSHHTRSCLGELTDLGRQSTWRLGHMIRALYVNRLGLVPDKLEHKDENLVAFRFRYLSCHRYIDYIS